MSRTRIVAVATAFFAVLVAVVPSVARGAGAAAGPRPVGAPFASRSPVYAKNGAAATTNALATGVALDVLRRGGTALDAALAANAVLGVVEPFNTGVGGDLFAIVWDPATRRLHGYNGSGRTPAALTLADVRRVLGADAAEIPAGPLSVSVSGAVEAWHRLHERFGRLPMKTLLAPAISYARDGFPVAPVAAHTWRESLPYYAAQDARFANLHATFAPEGRPPGAGTVFRNPDLARTLDEIARGGSDAFYRGRIADAVAAHVEQFGGALRPADLAAHRGEWVDPVSIRYRGYDVHELPPNTQGAVVLQVLRLLEGYDLRAMGYGSADYAHVLVESMKLAWEDRADLYADPAHVDVPLQRLLSPEYAAQRRALIDMRAARPTRGHVPAVTHTTYLTVADRDGMMVSLISSLFDTFGSGLVPPGLGFALQNRAAGMSLLAGHANAYAPGRRPMHTIIPAFVTKDGVPWFAFGVLGGSFQPQGHVQVLVNLIDFGMNVQEAGDAPRIAISGGPEPWNPRGAGAHRVHVERNAPDGLLEALRARGHDVRRGGTYFGGFQGIRRDPATGVYEAGSEMRMDGSAAGW